jgi:peptidylprolyl isomerase
VGYRANGMCRRPPEIHNKEFEKFGMLKRIAIPAWAPLLTILFLLAACGPAVPAERAAEMTREAETGESTETDETTTGVTVPGGSTVTDSGLTYIESVAGTGRQPEEGDILSMNVVGTLEDGTVFIDTYNEGGPIPATLSDDDLFPGWKEGLLLMREGGQAQLIIPPELAFGEEGAGGVIPPNATVTMDIELISATPPPSPPEVTDGDLTTTESGLQYYDLVEGTGDIPVSGQEVVVDYSAWLQEGDVFIASSFDTGEPITFALGSDLGVFPGWDEGVSTMKPGGRRLLVIPAELALGDQGGGRVPPNSTLLMEVELLEVKPLVLPTEISESDFTTTDSGLQYYDIAVGDGEEAVPGSTVTVNYTGWLTDNTKFDSSLDSGFPFIFTLGAGEVIPGWDEGIEGMQVGGVRQLVIPPELGYGEFGSGIIPPNADLVFEVELVDVQPAPTE